MKLNPLFRLKITQTLEVFYDIFPLFSSTFCFFAFPACPTGCATCTGPLQCGTCQPGYYGGKGGPCRKCHDSCLTCSSPGACSSCPAYRPVMDGGLCISKCPPGLVTGPNGCIRMSSPLFFYVISLYGLIRMHSASFFFSPSLARLSVISLTLVRHGSRCSYVIFLYYVMRLHSQSFSPFSLALVRDIYYLSLWQDTETMSLT